MSGGIAERLIGKMVSRGRSESVAGKIKPGDVETKSDVLMLLDRVMLGLNLLGFKEESKTVRKLVQTLLKSKKEKNE